MNAKVILCDFAQVADGKLTIVGGGWTFTGPDPSPFGVALLIDVPWSETNSRHEFRLALEDEDGRPVERSSGGPTITLGGEFELGRPAGLAAGADQLVPFAMNSGPIQLMPGVRYLWRVYVDGRTEDGWAASFTVREKASRRSA